ncbi:MAG: TetR/AcrR family transcriptional regulator [Gammaproteobacteria bacterium]
MAPRTASLPEPDLCREIIDAALERFLRFGYNKTTMAEIAEDSGMSAANLYRYFKNKQDIAAACCSKSLNERLERLRIVANSSAPFAEKLRSYALTMIEHTHELSAPDSKIGELVAFVTRERAELVLEKLNVHYTLIAKMLEQAIQDGEIYCASVENTARHIYSAFVIFDAPLFVGIYTIEEYKRRAQGVTELLINGLQRK